MVCMNLLDIDFQSIKTPIIDAFTYVYGEKYRDIIRKRINNIYFISYFDVEGIDSYIHYLRGCKGKELSLRFLDEIEVSTCYDRSNYSRKFDDNTTQVLDLTIHSIFAFTERYKYWAPLCAFDEDNHESETTLWVNRLKIINYFLKKKGEKIFPDELNSFMESDEFQEIYEEIKNYRNIYQGLLEEYHDWEKSLSSYLEFIKKEQDSKNHIYQEKKHELFFEIYPLLPKKVKDVICDKEFIEQEKIVFGEDSIDCPTLIESFSKEKMDKLIDPTCVPMDFIEIRGNHREYFNHFDINLPFRNLYDCDTKEQFSSYLGFLKSEGIQKYIPSQDIISFVQKTRKEKENEAFLEYLSLRSDYQKIAEEFSSCYDFLELILNIMRNKQVCITGAYYIDNKGNFIPFLCYAINRDLAGYLDFALLHESEHAIDKSESGCGMEPNDNCRYNPYNHNYRIYERFNETLNDIFAMEALEYLHKNGIYLLEPREIVRPDYQYYNTHLFTKKLLFPLLEKFREEVIAAKINTRPSILTQRIGEDNYEALVDTVNKVDYLCRHGLANDLKHNPDSAICEEYREQVQRATDIYAAIDEYSSKRDVNISYLEKNKTRNSSYLFLS